MLNANVAFLATQSIDDSVSPYRSPTQVASYLSIIASIGSIILGLLLVQQNRSKEEGTSDDAVRIGSTLLMCHSMPVVPFPVALFVCQKTPKIGS